ncbi:uncharacterized protein CIMG_03181 [Coccidioides immitis RS]|uniref:Polysaccharide lyase n=4 Tax=Coccidioides immitis TaxID=5501 RepID=J3KAS9_COCIM|nr:uncharacterized protein CIMG_03181 [Coccidioides immitis RS]EAS32157.3 hypothetical protein CIMG_03181 [Coccidioides immitis RS]KMP07360.1 hypothetical protein CIRG_07041 [Coccidioides immitis RMSCC 2394]KMU82440.1 hypothetical protein CIHG_00222 [Coccidioides immitis H538.4]TPX19330.1 hypothetical protein DIZ76_017119 [Coccidioides immitis]
MRILPLLFLAISPALSKLVVDYQAARGDDPSVMGYLNLEAKRGKRVLEHRPDLYIKKGKDPKGVACAHFHRKKGNIRAEYHALNKVTKKNKTYTIRYEFSLGQVQQSLMVWQMKEYLTNNPTDGGANVPLALKISKDKLQLQYQPAWGVPREVLWETTAKTNTKYRADIVMRTGSPGWVQFSWNGKAQKLGKSQKTKYPAITFPGRSDPKFGAYGGAEIDIDTYVYRAQIDEK